MRIGIAGNIRLIAGLDADDHDDDGNLESTRHEKFYLDSFLQSLEDKNYDDGEKEDDRDRAIYFLQEYQDEYDDDVLQMGCLFADNFRIDEEDDEQLSDTDEILGQIADFQAREGVFDNYKNF